MRSPAGRPARRALGCFVFALLLVVATIGGLELRAWRSRQRDARIRQAHTLAGTVERRTDFRSDLLGTTRGVWVYLPPHYAREPERRFPVLYLQDGQNVFDGATAFLAGKEWEVDETVERLSEAGRIEPIVVVAVDNGGDRRALEYLPTRDRRVGDGGGAALYARMLVEELKPWVDRTYRTRPGRESTGIGGSSFGGVLALHAGLSHPGFVSRIAALSTSAWVDDRFLVRFVDALPAKPQTLVWTDVGTREGSSAVADARALRDALVRKGWREGEDLRHVEAEGGVHDETAWAKRMPEVLEFLFPPNAAPPPATAPATPAGS